MHLATAEDIPFINSVLNHPMVRPHVWDEPGVVDASEAINIMWTVVVPGKGVMMAEAMGDGNYLGLTAFLPEAWGPEAVYAMRMAIRKIFTDTDCSCLYGSVKPSNLRASRNLVGLGFKDVGVNGNRVTGKIDYLDVLDEQMFIDTVKSGWPGKAFYWWDIKSRIQDVAPAIPLHPERPVFMLGGTTHDLS